MRDLIPIRITSEGSKGERERGGDEEMDGVKGEDDEEEVETREGGKQKW